MPGEHSSTKLECLFRSITGSNVGCLDGHPWSLGMVVTITVHLIFHLGIGSRQSHWHPGNLASSTKDERFVSDRTHATSSSETCRESGRPHRTSSVSIVLGLSPLPIPIFGRQSGCLPDQPPNLISQVGVESCFAFSSCVTYRPVLGPWRADSAGSVVPCVNLAPMLKGF